MWTRKKSGSMNDYPTGSTLKNLSANKVPEVTLGFWIIKILATTLGETGGDTVTMTWLKADSWSTPATSSEVQFFFQS